MAAASSEEQIVQQYNRLQQEQSAIMSRIAELENESHEHELVAEELRPLNGERCCHRLVGGALIERTVAEVLPEIEQNLAAIRATLEQLNKGLTEKEKQMDEFIAQHKLTRPGAPAPKENKASSTNGGAPSEAKRGVWA